MGGVSPTAERAAPRAAVVVNPTKVDTAKLRDLVRAAEREHGWRPSLWLETTEDDPGGGRAREAVEAGARVVLAAGGDGTVRAVAEVLRGTGVALALLPSGTGNILARNLELPLTRLEESVGTAFSGADRVIDVAVVEVERPDGEREERAFVVMAGIGIDAKMVANTRPELKKRVGWLAYVDAIARSLRDAEQLRVDYRIDGGEIRTTRVHTLLVGNCGILPGNLVLLPEARIDDGVLDIVALRPEGFFGWVQVWAKIAWEYGILRRSGVGRKLAGPDRPIRALRYLTARRIDVFLGRAEEFELDGDEFGTVVAFRARVEPGALVVKVPAP